jgi:flagellar hook-basal body complex protein FliE
MLIEQLAAGENVDIHQVMIASEQTDINFRIALAIRDKLVESYREVMRMAV